jgi:hypothetical protein
MGAVRPALTPHTPSAFPSAQYAPDQQTVRLRNYILTKERESHGHVSGSTPSSKFSRPARQLSSVVLPRPEGPHDGDHLPALPADSDAAQRVRLHRAGGMRLVDAAGKHDLAGGFSGGHSRAALPPAAQKSGLEC